MTQHSNEDIGDFFNKQLSLYDRVTASGLMQHTEMYATLTRFLSEQYPNSPFSLLDLGCNTAKHISQALQGQNISHFIGVDLASEALKVAKHNLSKLPCTNDLICEDIFEYIESSQGKYDVIFSSYALHHLNFKEKETFFKNCENRLNPDGCVIVIDIMKPRPMSDNEFNCLQIDNFKELMAKLPSDEYEAMHDHIMNADLAEDEISYQTIAKNAGLIYSNIKTIKLFNFSTFSKKAYSKSTIEERETI